MENKMSLLVMFEEDKADRNVSAYLPELGLEVIGDTLEDARENVKDSVYAQLEKEQTHGRPIALIPSVVKHVDSYSVLYEDTSHNVTAYVPALRLGVCGKDLAEAEDNVRDLIGIEIEQLRLNKRCIPQDSAIYETMTVNVSVFS